MLKILYSIIVIVFLFGANLISKLFSIPIILLVYFPIFVIRNIYRKIDEHFCNR